MRYEKKKIHQLASSSRAVQEKRTLHSGLELRRPSILIRGRSVHADRLVRLASTPMYVPDVIEYHLDNAIIVDDGIVLIDGFVVEETLADTANGIYGDISVSSEFVSWEGVALESDFDGLLLKKRGQTNYGHWLIELLPKLFLGNDVKSVIVSKPAKGYEFVSEMYFRSIELVSSRPRVNQLSRQAHIVKSLSFISGVSTNGEFFHPCIGDMAASLVAAETISGVAEKIFVTRPHAAGRGIVNQREVEEYFLSLGFRVVEPSSLTMREQISVFSNASELFGIQGAAMCNSIFSPRHAKVGYISPQYMNGRFFLNMEAAMQRANFNILFCETESSGKPTLRDGLIVDMKSLDDFYRDVVSV